MTTTELPRTVLASPRPGVAGRRKRPWRRAAGTGAFHTVSITLSVLWFFPIALVVFTSFRTYSDVVANGVGSLAGEGLTIGNYGEAWIQAGMLRAMGNSFLITIPVVFLTLALGSFAAFGLSRYRVRLRRTILLVMLAGNLLPAQLLLIPYVKIAEGLGVFDMFITVIAVQTAFGLGFYTFVLYGFMRAIPFELQDAASIDGAGPLRIYFQIILPLCRPALAALGALAFTGIFNDLLLAITLLRSDEKFPVTAAVLSLKGEYNSQWNLIAAATVIAAIPCVIVFLVFQRSFVGGLALGAVK
jgi:multiple sugar transport system permease protein